MKIKAVVKYLIITFVITYACWWSVAALVAYTDFVYGDILPTIIYIIGNFGPAIAALFCIDGRPYLHSLKKFLFSYKKRGIWFFLLFAALVTLTVGLSSMEWNPQMTALNFFISLLGSTFIYGGEEELGWRGILHPALSKKITFPLAALACGVIWALWHLPLWFIEGHPNQSMPFWVQATLGIFLCFWLGIIYKRSECLPLCMLFHGFVNVMLSSFVLKLNLILIVGILLTTAVAIALWLFDMKKNRARGNRPADDQQETYYMKIQRAETADLQAVHNITTKTISEVYPHYYPSGAVKIFLDYHNEEFIAKDIADGRVFLCRDSDGNAVGTVTLCDNEIQRLYVLPEYQGRGFGGALLEFAEQKLFKTFDEVIVEASLPAKGLYKKRGYSETEYLYMRAENGDFLCWDKMIKHR